MEKMQLDIMDADGSNNGDIGLEMNGVSSSDLDACQVNANQSAGPVSPSFSTPPPTLTPNDITEKSEDENLHDDDCSFPYWIGLYKDLPTIEKVADHLIQFQIKTKGKNKTAGQTDQIRIKAFEQASNPIIADYVADVRAIHDSFKDVTLKICECPQAMLGVGQHFEMPSISPISFADGQPGKSMNLDPSKEQELEKLGLDLSESESDDDSAEAVKV